MKKTIRSICVVAMALAGVASTHTVEASHSWGGYHWARTTAAFTLTLGDNLTSDWKPFLAQTSTDWSVSPVLDTIIAPGNTNNLKGRNTPKSCTPTTGRGEICNSKYGANGWLGIASIWASGTHITAGTVKLNDTYFSTPSYNSLAWKNLVTCQEVGHILGLAHQDEVFDNPNLNTCMDYSNSPDSNQYPNQHDYDMLNAIYGHLDTTTTIAATKATLAADSNNESDWGREIYRSSDRRSSIFEKNVGNDNRILRHVYWTEPRSNH